jgi:hypothetical protein
MRHADAKFKVYNAESFERDGGSLGREDHPCGEGIAIVEQ